VVARMDCGIGKRVTVTEAEADIVFFPYPACNMKRMLEAVVSNGSLYDHLEHCSLQLCTAHGQSNER